MAGRLRSAMLVMLLALGVACGDPFEPASRVTDNRVLGARAEVDGDPRRAWPMPGETLTVTWLVVDEGPARPLTWAFAWCPAAPTAFGDPFCVEGASPTLLAPQLEPAAGPPISSIDVPEGDALLGADTLLLLGIVCADGTLQLSPESLEDLDALDDACVGEGAKASPVMLSVPLQLGDATNHRPAIQEVRLDGQGWPEPADATLDMATDTCPEDPSVPHVQVPPGTEDGIRLALEVTGDSHERFTSETTGGEAVTRTESLRIQHVVTAGELPRLFSVLDDADDTVAELEWAAPPPEDRSSDPQLVRFHFVVTDGRAGTTFTSRALCLDAPP
jgi:hypothetical protein